jgi:phenylpropionate dioxygenase-like ring-hydroxylating dioxygenase large terminal subunit
MLFGFWYRALLGRKVRPGKMAKVTLLDTALVVGRDRNGRAFALRDACPHRGMPLSYGRFDGETIQCGLHGWKFDARTGQCRRIPACSTSQRIDLSAIRAGHVPCEERDGFLWVYLADVERAIALGSERTSSMPPSSPPALKVYSERYRFFDLSGEVPTGADPMLALLVDPAHGPFVHRRWWSLARLLFGTFVEESETLYEPIPFGFRESVSSPVPDRWSQRLAGATEMHVEADIVLPGTRSGTVRFGKFWVTALVTVTPVTATRCRVDQRVAWAVLYWMPFAATIMKFLFWAFFIQDRRAMARQAEGLGRLRRPMFVADADRPARWYAEIKGAFVNARRGFNEFQHPVPGPVTLRWRNASPEDR